MSDEGDSEISTEKCLGKICKYLLDKANGLDIERYEPYIDALGRLFRPTIERRAIGLAGHFASTSKTPAELKNGLDLCLVTSTTLERWFRSDGFAGIFVDSILLPNRLDKLGYELGSLGCPVPELHLDFTRACDLYASLDHWIQHYQSTFENYAPAPGIEVNPGLPTKRKDNAPPKGTCPATPAPDTLASPPAKDQRKVSDPTRGSSGKTECSQSKGGSKLKLVGNEVCRVGLPLEPRAPEEKGRSRLGLTAPEKSCQHPKDVRDSSDDPACTARDDRMRCKLDNVKAKLSTFTARMSTRNKQKCPAREDSASELDELYIRVCGQKDIDESTSSKTESDRSTGCERKAGSVGLERDARLNDFTPCYCAADTRGEEGLESKCKKKLEKNIKQLNSEIEELCRTTIPRELDKFKPTGVTRDEKPFRVGTGDRAATNRCPKGQPTKNAGTSANAAEDCVELTSIYINEVALCGCKDRRSRSVGVNTEVCRRTGVDAGTSTRCARCGESSTQTSPDEVPNNRNSSGKEREIGNVSYAKKDSDVGCVVRDRGTNTDEQLGTGDKSGCSNGASLDSALKQFCDSSCDSTALAGAIVSKINEIVELNEQIRKTYLTAKGDKEVFSTCVQTTDGKRSSDNVGVKVQVAASCVSVSSSIRKNGDSRSPVCDRSKRSTPGQPSVGADHARRDPCRVLQRCQASSSEFRVGREDRTVSVQVSRSTSNRYSRGDACPRARHAPSSRCQRCRYVQRPCRCSRKANFLKFLSDHLTREAFDKCKRMLRCVLRKIIEQAKALNELRRRRCRLERECRCCKSEESQSSSHSDTQARCERTSSIGEERSDSENPRSCRPRCPTRHRLVKARSSPDYSELEDRRCRIDAFASNWGNKPCGSSALPRGTRRRCR